MSSHGSTAEISIALGDGTSVDLSEYTQNTGVQLSRDTAETTVFGNSGKAYIPGLKDGTLPFAGVYDQAIDIVLGRLFETGEISTIRYHISKDRDIEYVVAGILKTYEISSYVADPNALSGEFQFTGDVSRIHYLAEIDGNDLDGFVYDGNVDTGIFIDGGAAA